MYTYMYVYIYVYIYINPPLLSVQGALQLKQDFDSIRELIQSDRYGLSAELHQRLLSLRYLHLSYNF